MQAQATRTEVQAISAVQSLTAVQTLLEAGLGCITFLRNLLPDDNFAESHLTTYIDSALPQSTNSDASFSSIDSSQGRNVNNSKIMTVTRGYSDEADKLLNYLEYGIFDALRRQYLRSFIFAIYLDPNDPSNIVEAYTFNFHYHTIPGTKTVVPIMSYGNPTQKTAARGSKRLGGDPVAEAIMKGKVPTLRDVKRSVKALLKTLIHAASQMDVLPRRRFATFKVFYTDETPADYEPPHFQAGDAEKDKWFFMTHDAHEMPDRWSIGKLDTGHHSVDVNITSIATYLPSSTEHDDAAFAGTTLRQPLGSSLSPVQEASLRAQQAENQSRDAEERKVAWSGEDAVHPNDIDGEGEDDPEYVRLPDGTYQRIRTHDSEVRSMAPVGMRTETGAIEPLMPSILEESEALFSGVSEPVLTRLQQLNLSRPEKANAIEQTQEIGDMTQDLDLASISLADSSGNNSQSTDLNDAIWEPVSSGALVSPPTSPLLNGEEIDSQLQDTVIETTDDTEMLDVETQINPFVDPHPVDSIESYGRDVSVDDIEADLTTPKPRQKTKVDEQIDNGLRCECSISIPDACCFCEGGCAQWYHVWCMGYHSDKDKRIPQKFICFDCRARADVSWDLIKTGLYPQILSKFRELALFRRAIKIVETSKAETPSEFGRKIGGDNVLARQLFKRLEAEGFITEQSTTLNDVGLPETRPRSLKGNRSKGKQGKNRKNVQRAKYCFNRAALSSVEYSDYFNPHSEVEGRILGLPEIKAHLKTLRQPLVPTGQGIPTLQPQHRTGQAEYETQTQDESQLLASLSLCNIAPKRTHLVDTDDTHRPTKKIKVSVAQAVDLAE